MIMRPCLHCRHREGCPIKADKLERARSAGLSLTVAEFRCPERLKGLEPGRRVSVAFRFAVTVGDAFGDPRIALAFEEPILGTIDGVTAGACGKLVVWLDAPSSRGKVRVRLYPDFPGLKILDAIVALCPECGRPPDGYRQPEGLWYCDTCGSPYSPDERRSMAGLPVAGVGA